MQQMMSLGDQITNMPSVGQIAKRGITLGIYPYTSNKHSYVRIEVKNGEGREDIDYIIYWHQRAIYENRLRVYVYRGGNVKDEEVNIHNAAAAIDKFLAETYLEKGA
jgi:hypothetical protein